MAELAERLASALADRYRIERELGAGGMATVYLAQDLKHDRPVALKVLRQELAAAMGAERFHREIQIAARLQHPHVLPLLDSGEAGGLLYYAMPFVEGQSLRERLAREGALPVGDAVRILRDVVDALTEAHAHGVVHRDIKPENIMLRGRHALVADFGVAKAVSEATGRQTLTTAGGARGTPAYMAPEQASADPHLDHRVDIYAVGAVAYELLTGRPVFMGTTPQMVLSAHVTEAPAPITRYRETVPRALEALVMRCLEKRPADRWQSAEELLPQLEAHATPSGGITPTETKPVAAIPGRRRLHPVKVVAAVVALIALGAGAVQLFRPKPLVITVSGVTQVTTESGIEYLPTISPDGKEVAFLSGQMFFGHLVVRGTANVAGSGEVRLTDTSLLGALFPSWSPDGDAVRFLACRAGYMCAWSEIGRLGGAVRTLLLPARARRVPWVSLTIAHPAWAADGRAAFVVRDTIFVAAADDTLGHRVGIHPKGYAGLHSLAWSPDGRRIAYVNGNVDWLISGNVAESSVWLVDAAGGTPHQVAGEGFLNVSPAWLDARHLLFVSDRDGPRAVYVVEVGSEGRRGELRLVPGIADPHSISYSIGSRTIAFSKFTLQQNIWSYPLAHAGAMSVRNGTRVTNGNLVIEEHDLSPDGKWLVFDSKRRGKMDIYKMPVVGGEPIQLTSLPGNAFRPRWSPDGKEIAFYSVPPGGVGSSVVVISADGGAPSKVFGPSGTANGNPVWSPSGREIAFQSNRSGQNRIWLVSRDGVGGPWREAVPLTDACGVPVWAPDGSGVLCDAGIDLVFVSPQGHVLWRRNLVPTAGLAGYGAPAYSRDGRTIYFVGAGRDWRPGVWAVPVAGGPPRLVVNNDDPGLAIGAGSTEPYRPDVGGDRLYLTVSEYESNIWVARLKW